MASTAAEIHPACPKCSGEGQAHAVEMKNGQRTVTYHCKHCDHQWAVTAQAMPPGWLPDSP